MNGMKKKKENKNKNNEKNERRMNSRRKSKKNEKKQRRMNPRRKRKTRIMRRRREGWTQEERKAKTRIMRRTREGRTRKKKEKQEQRKRTRTHLVVSMWSERDELKGNSPGPHHDEEQKLRWFSYLSGHYNFHSEFYFSDISELKEYTVFMKWSVNFLVL